MYVIMDSDIYHHGKKSGIFGKRESLNPQLFVAAQPTLQTSLLTHYAFAACSISQNIMEAVFPCNRHIRFNYKIAPDETIAY